MPARDPLADLWALLTAAAADGRADLDLSGRGLAELPDEVGLLGAVTALDLSGNALRAIPEALDLLGGLRRVSVRGNRLRHLRPLGWRELRALDAGDNALRDLRGWAPPPVLEELRLDGNGLRHLPRSAGLGHLRVLDVDRNALRGLPGVEGLRALEVLSVVDNPLRDLPDGLWALPGLREVTVDGDAWGHVPGWVRARGRPAVHVL